jgi:hypothetical protein
VFELGPGIFQLLADGLSVYNENLDFIVELYVGLRLC